MKTARKTVKSVKFGSAEFVEKYDTKLAMLFGLIMLVFLAIAEPIMIITAAALIFAFFMAFFIHILFFCIFVVFIVCSIRYLS